MRWRFAFAVVAMLASGASLAATRTWTGLGSSDNWSDAGNWDGGATTPVTGDALVFPSGAGRSASKNDLANPSYASISFTGYAPCVSGPPITLTSASPLSVSNGPACLAMAVTLSAPGTVTATIGPTFDVRGPVTLTGNTLQFSFTGPQSAVSLPGSNETAPSGMGCTGMGIVYLHGTQNYSGYGSFDSCDVVVDVGSSLGTTAQGTNAQLVSFFGSTVSHEAITLVAPGDPTYGALIFTNDFSGASSYTAYIDGTLNLTYAGTRVTANYVSGFRGPVIGAGGFTLLGQGRHELWSSSNSYAGATLVASGNLVLVADEVIPDTSDVQVGVGGTFTMGNTRETVRSVNFAGAFNMNITDASVAGGTFTQLIALNGVTLGGSLNVTQGSTLAQGTVLEIIDNRSGGAVSGTFDNLPEGATFFGPNNRFQISYVGGDGNDVTLTVVQPIPPFNMQDMWWGGSAENGWGMSIVQHRDILFNVIYVYDGTGKPTWYVMPSGQWNGTGFSYTGALYSPRGSPFYAYDVSQFKPGQPAGVATVTFSDAGHATLDYNINGFSGHKALTRQSFGPPAQFNANYGDMWWGGINQNGWGIAILQQGASLFSVWFTYDANGFPTWYVMPAGSWINDGIWQGRMYRTTGSPWVGTTYDASKLQVFDVGPYTLRFVGENAFLDYNVEGRTGTLQLDHQPF